MLIMYSKNDTQPLRLSLNVQRHEMMSDFGTRAEVVKLSGPAERPGPMQSDTSLAWKRNHNFSPYGKP